VVIGGVGMTALGLEVVAGVEDTDSGRSNGLGDAVTDSSVVLVALDGA